MTVLDFARPPKVRGSAADGSELVIDGEGGRGDAPLERAASRVRAGVSLWEALAAFDGTLAELFELLEGVYWDPEKHPRWPQGTPGGLGGQFMRAGQRFSLKGVEYDVDKVLPGKIYAHVATHGTSKKPATVEFSTADLTKVERPAAEPIKGVKSGSWQNVNATVLDPYVKPETHDVSIPVPAESTLTAEQWKTFGKQDQEWYSLLMERHGAWHASGAQAKVDKAMAAGDQASRDILSSSYSSQFGSSSGFSISLHGLYSGLLSKLKGSAPVEETRARFEKARALQAEAAGVLQWDLYNRTHGPDIAIFHKHSDHSLFQHEIIDGGKPVFAGLSQSQFWRAQFFGPHTFATPMAIRHIVMSTVSADVTHYGGFNSEQEVATADPFVADARSLEAQSMTAMQAKWLSGITSNHKSAPGSIIAMLKQSMADGGTSLPVLPVDPMIQMDGEGGKQWQTPPKDATEFATIGGKKVSVLDLPYAHIEGGKPVAKKMKDMVAAGEIQAGDYIEGMQGTRYLVVPDPSDAYLGLAYYKVTDVGKAVPGTEFKAPTGQDSSAFSGHALFGGEEAFTFEGGGEKAWKKLVGHTDLPVQSEKQTGFYPEAWSVGGPDDVKFVKDFQPGQKFMVGTTAYEVAGELAGMQKKIVNLTTGKQGKINGDCKLPPLVLNAGYTETGEATVSPDDFLHGETVELGSALDKIHGGGHFLVGQTVWKQQATTADGHVEAAQASGGKIGQLHTFAADQKVTLLESKPPGWEPAQVGDTFAFEGGKATITKLLKDGTVQAKKQAGGVVKLGPNDAALAYLHRPSAWELGDKAKLKTLAPGEKFHGGTGVQQIRPYVVVGQHGKTTEVRNLDTGEVLSLSAAKSYPRLLVKQTAAAAPVFDHAQPQAPDAYDPGAWEAGPEKLVKDMVEGDKFFAPTTQGAVPYEITGPAPNGWHVVNLQTGATQTVKDTWATPLATLVPKQTPAVAEQPVGEWQPFVKGGAFETLGDLKPGDQMKALGDDAKATVWEVTGPPVNGQVPLKVVASASPASVGSTPTSSVNFAPEDGWTFKLAPAPPGMAPNTLSLLQLPIGAKVAMSPNPDDPTVKVPAVWELVGFSGDQADLQLVTPMINHSGASFGTAGTVNGFSTDYVFENVALPGATLPEATVAAPSAPSSFDPSAYITTKNLDPGTFTLGDMEPGEVFQGKKGGHYLVKSKSADGANVNATVLDGEKAGQHTKFKATVQPAAILTPKAETKTPYEDLLPSDPVQLGDLLQGDQFVADSGVLYQVIEPSGGVDEKTALIAPVLPSGELGIVGNYGTAPSLLVKFHAKKVDTVIVPVEQAAAMQVDVESLPAPPGYASYAFHKSGKKVYPKLSMMADGVIFHDSDGLHYKVKQSGPTPVITDGESLFKADGDWRGFVVDPADAPALTGKFGDVSPPVVQTHQDVEAQLATAQVEELIQPDVPEPTGMPVIPDAEVESLVGQPLANTLPLSALASGTQFKASASSESVWEVVGKKGSKVQVKVVVPDPSSSWNVGDKQTMSAEGVPDLIGVAGSFDAVATASGLVPTAPSSDLADYVEVGKGLLADAPPGVGFAKGATGDVVYQITGPKDAAGMTPIKNLSSGMEFNAGMSAVVFLEPKGDTGGSSVDEGPFVPGDYEQVNAYGGSAGDFAEGAGLPAGTIVRSSSNGTFFKVLGTTTSMDSGEKTLSVQQVSDSDGETGLAALPPPMTIVPGAHLTVWKKTGLGEPTAAQKIAALTAWKEPGHPVAPEALVVGDRVKSTFNGLTFTVTAKTEPNAQGSFQMTLKDESNGKVGSGSYAVGDATNFEYIGPAAFEPKQGDPVTVDGKPYWVKGTQTDSNNNTTLLLGTSPGGSGASNGPSNVLIGSPLVTLGHPPAPVTPLTGSPFAEPEVADFKPAKDFQVGDVIQGKAWGAGVYRVKEVGDGSYAKKTVLTVVKPQQGRKHKPGDEIYATSTIGAFRLYKGGAMWKPGEYAKVVKPGNASGSSVRVVGYDGGLIRVRYANGKEVSVDGSWLHGTKPTYATREKLKFAMVPAGELKPGDIFALSGFYSAAVPYVIDSANADGTLETHKWGGGGSMALNPGSTVEPLVAGRSIAAMFTPPPKPEPGSVKTESDPNVGDWVHFTDNPLAPPTQKFAVVYTDKKGLTVAHEPGGDAQMAYSWSGWHSKGGETVEPPSAASSVDDLPPEPTSPGMTKLGSMKVGTVFVLPQNMNATEKWEVTAAVGSSPDYPEFLYAKSLSTFNGVPLPFGTDVEGGVVSEPEPPAFEEKLQSGLASILGAADESAKVPLGSLQPYATFHTGEVWGSPEGDYVVAPHTEGLNWGILPGNSSVSPSDVVFATDAVTGEHYWFGAALAVTPVEAKPPVVLHGEKVPGHPIEYVADMQAGDHFETVHGNVYHVISAVPAGAAGVTLTFDLAQAAPGMDPAVAASVKPWTSEYKDSNAENGGWKWASPPAGQLKPEPELAGPAADVLSVYSPKFHKSGQHKTPKIGTLAAGTKFHDKSGKVYTVLLGGATGMTHYADAAGQEYATSADSRVVVE